jgi:hypothetical protein
MHLAKEIQDGNQIQQQNIMIQEAAQLRKTRTDKSKI